MGYNYDVDHGAGRATGPLPEFEPDFHGAAVIAADGREVPITEAMVNGALESLHHAWQRAQAEQQGGR